MFLVCLIILIWLFNLKSNSIIKKFNEFCGLKDSLFFVHLQN